LVERLYNFKSNDPKIIANASLLALEYLEEVNQASPYIEQLITRLEPLYPINPKAERFLDPQWNISIQNNKMKKLKSSSNENFYHETDVTKTIEIAEFFTYNKQFLEATNVLSSSSIGSPTCQLAEYSAQVALIQGNYAAALNQDKRVEAFLTTSLSNELYLKRLTDQEVTSYWRVKFLILIAHFLKKDYSEVVSLIYDLINAPFIQTASGKQISALQVLKGPNFGKFVHEEEIVLASIISILISKRASELNNVLNQSEFSTLVGSKIADVRPFFISLNTAKFKELNVLLDQLDELAESNVFLNKVWPSIRLNFREKSYALYLRLTVRVSADHLSHRLNIPKDQIVKEIQNYIKDKHLEISYDENNEIFETKKTDKRVELVETLQKLSEDSDNVEARLKDKLSTVQNTFIKAKNAIGAKAQESSIKK